MPLHMTFPYMGNSHGEGFWKFNKGCSLTFKIACLNLIHLHLHFIETIKGFRKTWFWKSAYLPSKWAAWASLSCLGRIRV